MVYECTICQKRNTTYKPFVTDIGLIIYICQECYSFRKEEFKDAFDKLRNDKDGQVSYIIQEMIRILSQFNSSKRQSIEHRLNTFFGKSFPWEYIFSKSNKLNKLFNIYLSKGISLNSKIPFSWKNELKFINILKSIDSAKSFINHADVILNNVHVLEFSARHIPIRQKVKNKIITIQGNKEAYLAFITFHRKFDIYFKEIKILNFKKAVQIVESIEPIYEIILKKIGYPTVEIRNRFLNWQLLLELEEGNKEKKNFSNIEIKRQETSLEISEQNNIIAQFPLESFETIEIKNILIFFQEHAWQEISKRKRGLPAGDWYSAINCSLLNKSGYDYFTVKERDSIYYAETWSKDKYFKYDFQFRYNYKIEGSVLFTYILCAISDILADKYYPEENVKEGKHKLHPFIEINKNGINSRYYPLGQQKNISAFKDNNNQITNEIRKGYMVSWHLRKLKPGYSSSNDAQKKALIHAGIIKLPEGFTFIKQHWRGGENSNVETRIITNILTDSLTKTLDSLVK